MAKRIRRSKTSGDVILNITALADTMVVLLVFLLKSSASGALDITPSAGLTLPEGTGPRELEESLKIEISQRSIKFEDKDIMPLINFRMRPTEFRPDGASSSLVAFFSRNRAKIMNQDRKLADDASQSKNRQKRILVLADSRTPYGTIRRVFASAANEGLGKFKLVVVRKE